MAPKIKLSKRRTPQTEVHEIHYKSISIDDVILQIGKKDSCFISITDEVIILEDVISNENLIFLVGKLFKKTNNFYTYPLPSSIFGIISVSQISKNVRILPLSEIKAKAYARS